MIQDGKPARGRNPSLWRHRWPVLLLALIGCGIATYLTLYQVGIVANVWEPFFGDGSRKILKESAIAHLLPIPDAALGAAAYFIEAVGEWIGSRQRWREQPWAVLWVGLVSIGLAITGLALVICQPLLFGAFCTLCLCSAACSLLIFCFAARELSATLGHLKRAWRGGQSLWSAVFRGWGNHRALGAK